MPKSSTLKNKTTEKGKRPAIEEPEQDVIELEAEDSGSEEEEAQFEGFSSDSDSSDEELDQGNFDVGSLPTIAKDDASVKRRLDIAKRKEVADRGVIYIGHIPHGFYEDQMREYFGQFGDVTRLRLSRSKKTGRSKHFGFIEFASSAVAEIVAETMDNYLISQRLLTCKLVPSPDVHPNIWIGANRKYRPIPSARIAREKHNKTRTESEVKSAERRLLKRQAEKKRKIEASGISYDFDFGGYNKACPVDK